MLAIYARTIRKRSLLKMEISFMLKNPQQILVITDQLECWFFSNAVSRRAATSSSRRRWRSRLFSSWATVRFDRFLPDYHTDVARSFLSHVKVGACAPVPLSTLRGRGHGGLRSPTDPADESDLIFSPPPEPLEHSLGRRRFHVGVFCVTAWSKGSGIVTWSSDGEFYPYLTALNLDNRWWLTSSV